MANRLSTATSPYLLQHADNPVDWWPWGDEPFAEARRRDVPVLLSVGYSACHWCHVMAHESFEDPAVAELMNSGFVNVKVDREERPDVDAVYMQALQAMSGQGGWPMTVFLTPDGLPFYAGTYFPPAPRHGLPSFPQLLTAVAETWRERGGAARSAAERISSHLADQQLSGPLGPPPTAQDLAAACLMAQREFDPVHAGFGSAPKFPPSMLMEFLLRHHARTGDADALVMVARTGERMARGGMYDQLGGGFARYSVDREWVVPHFEKMLYDNALLLRAYLHWWQLTGEPLAERVVRETAGFLLRDLRTAEGGFAAALDADSLPVDGPGGAAAAIPAEGAAYVWTPAQLVDVLGDVDGSWAAALLRVTEDGTFEHGASVLQLPRDPDDAGRWADVRATLHAARDERPQPARDDKVLAAWNGLAIAALAEAGLLLAEPAWVEAAVTAADLLVSVHLDSGGRLRRTSRDGVAGTAPGVLEDYADVAEGALALLAVTGDPAWLDLADRLLDVVLTRFADPDGPGFHDVADDALDPRLAGAKRGARPQDPTDAATPSGWAAACGALLAFGAVTGSGRHRDAAEGALGLYGSLARRSPRLAGWGLAVAEARVAGPLEVAVVGRPDDARRDELHRAALRPGVVVAVGDPGDPTHLAVPLLRDRPLVDGAPAAYVCRGFVCERPVTSADALTAALRR